MKGISRIIDMLISSGRNGDISVDSNSLLEKLVESEYKAKHWWEIPYQKGLRLVLILAATIMMLTVIIYYGIFYINDVILYDNQLVINEQGAFNPKKSMNCEYAFYLFNTAELWANTGIQVNEKDLIRINISGAFNSAVEYVIAAAEDNTELTYQWVSYQNTPLADTVSKGIEFCVSNYRKETKHDSHFEFGTAMFVILPESANLKGDPLHGLSGEPLEIKKWTPKTNQRFIRAKKSGTLYFAVNDMYFQDNSTMEAFYKNEKNKNANGKPFSQEEINARIDRPKHDYEDNLGQLLVSVEIQRHVPYFLFYPTSAYRIFDYQVNYVLDSDMDDFFLKPICCVLLFLLFFLWIALLLGLYLIALLFFIYLLFFVGNWVYGLFSKETKKHPKAEKQRA